LKEGRERRSTLVDLRREDGESRRKCNVRMKDDDDGGLLGSKLNSGVNK